MPILPTKELGDQLRRREISPVYVLYGAEAYLRDIAADRIVNLAFAEGDLRDFNETEINLNSDDDVSRAIAAAEQLPMMSSRRVVRINGVRVSSTGVRDTVKEEHEPLISAYLDSPASSSVVIFVADELNGNRKMGKLLRSKAVAVEFAQLDDEGLRAWTRTKFSEHRASADEVAIRHLVATVGNDLRHLTNEIQKLATAAMPDKPVTVELIDSLVPNTRDVSNFAFTDSLNQGDRAGALRFLKKALDDGAEPLMLLGSISYNYRRLLMAKDLMERGVERREVEKILNLRYGFQEKFLSAARRADRSLLERSLGLIAETDVAIKTSLGGSGPSGAQMQIEKLVCELARG